MPLFNYSKLCGRITEKFGTQKKFAQAMNWGQTTLSFKLNNKSPWTQKEIMRAGELLDIEISETSAYFFCPSSLDN